MSGPALKICPSILSADFGELNAEVAKVTNADWLHVDVMDGQFVPAITIGAGVMKHIKTGLPLDVHLMVDNPERQFKPFAEAGASYLTFHLEACGNPRKILAAIRELGVKAGLAVNPATPIEKALPFLGELDLLIVMTVVPGKGGQSFMEDMLEKVRIARKRAPQLDIMVDGGITTDNIGLAAAAGANAFVAGSFVFKHGPGESPAQRVETLRKEANQGRKGNENLH